MPIDRSTTLAAAGIIAVMGAGIWLGQQPPATGAGTVEAASFEDRVRGYLLENPEILVEMSTILEDRQAEANRLRDRELVLENLAALHEDGFSFVGGNPEGSITVVEFIDYRCSFCKRVHPEMLELIARNDDIRLIRKEFPILGADSVLASQAALAVLETAGSDIYDQYSDALMTYNGPITETVLLRFAATAGADPDAVLAMMSDPVINERLVETRQLGQRLGISGTPTFVFEDTMVRGYLPLEDLQAVVDGLREEAS
ncbi:MAG: DsbA family protein [Rubricella sp.]